MPIENISGVFTRSDLDRLTWPIAWSGEPDREYEAALSRLVEEATEALVECPDGYSVEIVNGVVVSVLADPG